MKKRKAKKKRQVIFLHMNAKQRSWLGRASSKLSARKGKLISRSKIVADILAVYQRASIATLESLVFDGE